MPYFALTVSSLFLQHVEDNISPTVSFHRDNVQRWLADMAGIAGFLNGILAVIHKSQYQYISGKLDAWSDSDPDVEAWPFAFGAFQIMVNRQTLLHRDPSGRAGMYDLVLTVGDYGEQAYMALPALGVSLPYDSGTVVALDAVALQHGVPHVDGHRICIAFFNRGETIKVWEGNGEVRIGLPTMDHFLSGSI